MRFEAPARDAVPPAVFAHPIYAGLAAADLLCDPQWPSLARLNAALGDARHTQSAARLRFVAQSPALLADGLHYEVRIHDHGVIATRECNWHDLFNACAWLEQRALKCAVNTAYRQEFRSGAGRQRSRRQSALTHFDEAGALVLLREPALLAAWDRHDWHGLLWRARAQWLAQTELVVFGHALREHALVPAVLPVAKCVVVVTQADRATVIEAVADAIVAGRLLQDPQSLRPLPLAGLPGWHPDADSATFYRSAPCFRPLRAGRRYPAPFVP